MKSVEGDNMEEIDKLIIQCEKANIPSDDPDLEYARRKLEVLTLRKGINIYGDVLFGCSKLHGYFTLFFILLYTLADLYKNTRRQQT